MLKIEKERQCIKLDKVNRLKAIDLPFLFYSSLLCSFSVSYSYIRCLYLSFCLLCDLQKPLNLSKLKFPHPQSGLFATLTLFSLKLFFRVSP